MTIPRAIDQTFTSEKVFIKQQSESFPGCFCLFLSSVLSRHSLISFHSNKKHFSFWELNFKEGYGACQLSNFCLLLRYCAFFGLHTVLLMQELHNVFIQHFQGYRQRLPDLYFIHLCLHSEQAPCLFLSTKFGSSDCSFYRLFHALFPMQFNFMRCHKT